VLEQAVLPYYHVQLNQIHHEVRVLTNPCFLRRRAPDLVADYYLHSPNVSNDSMNDVVKTSEVTDGSKLD
jgi:hypothetical protein